MFTLKIVQAVETDTKKVFKLMPVGDGLSGELFLEVGLDTPHKVGCEFIVEDPVMETPIEG